MTNASGGDLLAAMSSSCLAGTADNSFTTTTTASYTAGRVGILLEDIASAADGLVAYEGVGFYAPTIASGTPAAGDYLFTSTTAGAATYSSTRAAGAFGRVVSTDGTDIGTVDLWGETDASYIAEVIRQRHRRRAGNGQHRRCHRHATDA